MSQGRRSDIRIVLSCKQSGINRQPHLGKVPLRLFWLTRPAHGLTRPSLTKTGVDRATDATKAHPQKKYTTTANNGKKHRKIRQRLLGVRAGKKNTVSMTPNLNDCFKKPGHWGSRWTNQTACEGVEDADGAQSHGCRGRPSRRISCCSKIGGHAWPAKDTQYKKNNKRIASRRSGQQKP